MQTGNLIIVLVITGKAQDQPTETLQQWQSWAGLGQGSLQSHQRGFTLWPGGTVPEIIHCLFEEKVANRIAEVLSRAFRTSN